MACLPRTPYRLESESKYLPLALSQRVFLQDGRRVAKLRVYCRKVRSARG
jgi:hypothetical protein